VQQNYEKNYNTIRIEQIKVKLNPMLDYLQTSLLSFVQGFVQLFRGSNLIK
jgi:hypothetical protein